MGLEIIGRRLVVASHNPGKAAEIAALLAPFDIEVLSAAELGLEEPEETGETFAQNATLKAEAATRATGLPALADDSGLVVSALNGDPGIRSARWAGPERDFDLAMRRVEQALGGARDRRAHFICNLCLAWPEGHSINFEGRVDGTLVWPPRGDRGFGYDPMFLPEGHRRTFGEMEAGEKHELSHRARAFAKLVAELFQAA
jgi:XTP/dITP diphosphohydrolase